MSRGGTVLQVQIRFVLYSLSERAYRASQRIRCSRFRSPIGAERDAHSSDNLFQVSLSGTC